LKYQATERICFGINLLYEQPINLSWESNNGVRFKYEYNPCIVIEPEISISF
jgi:hypothetical protein